MFGCDLKKSIWFWNYSLYSVCQQLVVNAKRPDCVNVSLSTIVFEKVCCNIFPLLLISLILLFSTCIFKKKIILEIKIINKLKLYKKNHIIIDKNFFLRTKYQKAMRARSHQQEIKRRKQKYWPFVLHCIIFFLICFLVLWFVTVNPKPLITHRFYFFNCI